MGRRRGRRHLAHERRDGGEAGLDPAARRPADQRLRLAVLYDAAHHTLYAGSGEPNGSGDSEAGLGLFKSTDFGATWTLVAGSDDVAINRSIGAIAVDPANPDVIYIGTALARHGSASVNGGRRTPPGAPPLGVYKSTDAGATFNRLTGLSSKTPATPVDPAAGTGSDFFQGGINKIELDPNHPGTVYAAVIGYGLWRSKDTGTTWEQIFHTMNQTAVSGSDITGDVHGDRTEFDLVDVGGTTRAYLGDASDDYALDDDDSTPLPQVWRDDDAFNAPGAPDGDNGNQDWDELSNTPTARTASPPTTGARTASVATTRS